MFCGSDLAASLCVTSAPLHDDTALEVIPRSRPYASYPYPLVARLHNPKRAARRRGLGSRTYCTHLGRVVDTAYLTYSYPKSHSFRLRGRQSFLPLSISMTWSLLQLLLRLKELSRLPSALHLAIGFRSGKRLDFFHQSSLSRL